MRPEIGRFLTKDTVKGDVLNPQTLNLYAYCLGDPVNYKDTSGHKVVGTYGDVDYEYVSQDALYADRDSEKFKPKATATSSSAKSSSVGTAAAPREETWVSHVLTGAGFAVGLAGLIWGGPVLGIIAAGITAYSVYDMAKRGVRDPSEYILTIVGGLPLVGGTVSYGTKAGGLIAKLAKVDGREVAKMMGEMGKVTDSLLVKGIDFGMNLGWFGVQIYPGRKR